MNALSNLSFRNRILVIVGIACAICATTAFIVSQQFQERELRASLVDKARTVLSRLDAATDYVANQGGLKPAIDRTVHAYTSPQQLTEEDKHTVLKQVPIFAAMKIGARIAEQEHYSF